MGNKNNIVHSKKILPFNYENISFGKGLIIPKNNINFIINNLITCYNDIGTITFKKPCIKILKYCKKNNLHIIDKWENYDVIVFFNNQTQILLLTDFYSNKPLNSEIIIYHFNV